MKVKLKVVNSNSREGEFEKIPPPELEIITIGRHPSSFVYLNSAHISKEHALIIREYENFFLVDKSTNGTILNSARVEREKRNPLRSGDIITVGEYRITFSLEQDRYRAEPAGAAEPAVAKTQDSQPAFDMYTQDPLSDPSLDPADTIASFSPTSFEDVIRNLEPGEESSYLIFVGGSKDGQRIELRGSTSEIYIGRGPNCQVQISHQSIAQTHAKIRMDWAGITIYDLNNQGGVFINGVRINSSRKLHNGDEISFGIPVSQGGVKLILYDRNSISGDSWIGLPPPVSMENEKEPERSIPPEAGKELQSEAPPPVVEEKRESPQETEVFPAEDLVDEKLSLKSFTNLNQVIYAGVTIREAIIILVLIVVVLIFSIIALSFLGI
jgi:pSer/pThr/pTyr-binding forkhead associated (FHA) protein